MIFKVGILYLHSQQKDFVAQLVEQMTLNHRVQSSSLCGITQNFYYLFLAANHWFAAFLFPKCFAWHRGFFIRT